VNAILTNRIAHTVLLVVSFVFTVGGVVLGAWHDLWYVWVLALISISCISYVLSATFYQSAKFAQAKEEENRTRLSLMEQEVNPSFQSLQQALASYSLMTCVNLLKISLNHYSRMKKLTDTSPQGLNVLLFRVQDESLFATTKLPGDKWMDVIVIDDIFLLYHTGQDSIETLIATTVLHQPMTKDSKLAVFRIEEVASESHYDALKHLALLSSSASGDHYLLRPRVMDMEISEGDCQRCTDILSQITSVIDQKTTTILGDGKWTP